MIRPPLFSGWVVVGGAFLVLFTAYGAQFAFGVFFAALLEEFGWSRASLSGVFSLYAFAYAGLGLVAGALTDRWGPRVVIALGGGFLGLGLLGMSATSALWHPYVLYGVVAAIGMSSAYVPCNATVARWFVRRRGLAVGLASAGGSLGNLAFPPLAYFLVSRVGWRWAYIIFGAGLLVVLNLVATVMRRDPESVGLAPDGDRLARAADAAPVPEPGWTVREATGTAAFWMLFAVFAATWIPVFVPLVHLIPLALGLGVPPFLAATLVSAIGGAGMLGRLVLGSLSDRIGRRPAIALGLALQASAFVGFATARSLGALYVAAVIFGFSYAAVSTLFPAIVADLFGRRRAGSLVGLLFTMAGSMAALGPVAAGWIYDRTGSYEPAFWLAVGFNAVALGALALARPPAGHPATAAASSS